MALKNIMRVDNGKIVGADTEARNFINNNLITSVNGTDVEFKFIYDSTQDKFGYRDASGTFVPFESGGDFSQLIYENLAAANIKKGVTINVKDPDGNLLNGATGSYEVNTFTNLTAANIKNGTTITIEDSAGTTLKSVTGTYSPSLTCVRLYANAGSYDGSGSVKTTREYKAVVVCGSRGTLQNGAYTAWSSLSVSPSKSASSSYSSYGYYSNNTFGINSWAYLDVPTNTTFSLSWYSGAVVVYGYY